jgi:hypothetical protein
MTIPGSPTVPAPSDNDRYTVGVFQDASWARRGVEALLADGFTADAITILARQSADAEELIRSTLGAAPRIVPLKALGPALARGPLVGALQRSDEGLSTSGLGASMRRAGFLEHDGYIYETLVGRGGVLVAVRSEPRAADALAKLHAYGGGNAAIGAWTGRV